MENNLEKQWFFKHFSDISKEVWYKIVKKRIEIFIVEQNCTYQDLDNKDLDAYHVFCMKNNSVIAYSRILAKGVSYPKSVSIGRVLVDYNERRNKLGSELMINSIRFASYIYEDNDIEISAQQHLEGFYKGFGFNTITDSYLEDGIPHIGMLLSKV